MNRDADSMKVSIHASGQIHLRIERRDLQLLAPPLLLDGTSWYHSLEIRYLISANRFRPVPKKLKKKDKAFLVDIADSNALILNLMVGPPSEMSEPVPPQFAGARPLWQSRLADGRRVLLIARVMPLNQENEEHIARLRDTDGPEFTFAGGTPESPNVELSEVIWTETGSNVVPAEVRQFANSGNQRP